MKRIINNSGLILLAVCLLIGCTTSEEQRSEVAPLLKMSIDSIVINKTIENREALIQQDVIIYVTVQVNSKNDTFHLEPGDWNFKLKGDSIYIINHSAYYVNEDKKNYIYELLIVPEALFDLSLREMDRRLQDLLKGSTLYLYQGATKIDSLFMDTLTIHKSFCADGVTVDKNDLKTLNKKRVDYIEVYPYSKKLIHRD